jgi:hypothetical protein
MRSCTTLAIDNSAIEIIIPSKKLSSKKQNPKQIKMIQQNKTLNLKFK